MIRVPLRTVLLCAATAWVQAVAAQQWRSLGDITIPGPGSPAAIYGDSVFDKLFVGGTWKWIVRDGDSLKINSIATWDGAQWDTLGSPAGCGDGNICQQVYWFLRYQNDLFVNGSFAFYPPGSPIYYRYFARITGADLHLEGVTCPSSTGEEILTIVPDVTNDTLYFTGYRGSVCGLTESNVFAYDGENFTRWEPFDDWPYTDGDYVGLVFKYLDRFYMTGLLDDSTTNAYYGLLRYMDDHWEPVPGFETSAPFKDFLIHNDTLYLCGYFFEGPGVPGNMVVAYDGEHWDNLGGGITFNDQGTQLGVVLDLEWWHGKLLAAGQFYRAGGEPIEHIAAWDGHRWCGSGADFAPDNAIMRMAIWRDSLYVVGGFDAIDGVPIHRVAHWDGGDLDAVCSPAVGVEETEQHQQPLARLLDPDGLWWIPLDGHSAVRVHDASGRLVMTTGPNANGLVDLRSLSPGMYVTQGMDAQGRSRAIKLYRP